MFIKFSAKTWVALAIFLLLAIGAALGAFLQNKATLKEYSKLQQSAELAHQRGEVNTSISLYTEMIKKANNPNDWKTTDLKHLLAYDLFVRNQGNDRAEAAKILREIISNNNVSQTMRALTINDLIDFYFTNLDDTFARENIFKGEVLEPMLQSENGNVGAAAMDALRYSDQLYPTPYASFYIALGYGRALSKNNENLTEEKRQEFTSELRKWTENGEALITSKGFRPNLFRKAKLGHIYAINAANRSILSQISQDETVKQLNMQLAEKAYNKSLETIAPEDDANTYKIGLYVRFHYALLLLNDGEKRRNDIKILLEPIVNTPPKFKALDPPFFDEFLKRHMSRNDNYSLKKNIVDLARLVPEFRNVLIEKGINIQDN